MAPEAVVGCVVVAGGSGTRLGLGVPKALAGAGPATLLELAVARAAAAGPVTGRRTVAHLVVVVPAAVLDTCADLVERAWAGAGGTGDVTVVPGGAHRQASVSAGLDALPPDTDVVLVHDAARALAPSSLFAAVAEAVRGDVVAVVPGLTPSDTVKRLEPEGRSSGQARASGTATDGLRQVAETLDRAALVVVQTPQGFRAGVLRQLHRAAQDSPPATDDAGMAEAAGYPVVVVPGHPEAFKVTTPTDLVLARALLQQPDPGQDGPRDS